MTTPCSVLPVLSIDPSIATLLAAAIAAMVAVAVYVLGQRQASRQRKREACAKALSDALAWLELPYRIRRRPDDSGSTLAGLAGSMHQLQERLLYHQNWLRIEVPDASDAYEALVKAVKDTAEKQIQEAWTMPPASKPENMSVGDLGLASVEAQSQAFADATRRCLS
jgi:hypothetical protein